MSLPALLYHGTSTKYLKQMLRDGLRAGWPQCWPEPGSYLCFADQIEIAQHHARHMAEWDRDQPEDSYTPIVFVIPIKRFMRSAFCLERNFIRLGPSAGRAVGKRLPKRRWHWYALLKHAGSVGYRRTVTVTAADIITH